MKKTIALLFSLFLIAACSTSKRTVKVVKEIEKDTVVVKKTEIIDYRIKKANPKGFDVRMDHYPSLNQNERVRFVVLHYTSADYDTSVKLLTGEIPREVSSHYLIGADYNDPIQLLVEENKRAWHAGRSYWRGRTNLNDSSIGIEIVNLSTSIAGEMVFEEYPQHQIKKVVALLEDILERYPDIDPTNVIGHSDLAPQRKHDPGPTFPWKMLYEKHNIGAWYDLDKVELYMSQYPHLMVDTPEFIRKTQEQLETYGYEIEATGVWDQQTSKVLRAFQYHFRPENYDGNLDPETWAILQSLIQKYRS